MRPPRTDPPSFAEQAELPAELPALANFAARLPTDARRPSAAALAVALAADLVAQGAERTRGWDARGGVLAQTDVLRERATSAAGSVAAIYHVLVEALAAAVVTPPSPAAASDLGEELAHGRGTDPDRRDGL